MNLYQKITLIIYEIFNFTKFNIFVCSSLNNVKEKEKWNNSKIFDHSLINNVDYSLIRDDYVDNEIRKKNKYTGNY